AGLPGKLTTQQQNQILGEADERLREIAALRGLEVKRPVEIQFRDKAFFRTYYARRLAQEYPADQRKGWEKAFKMLGFLSPDSTLIPVTLEALVNSSRGFYDPASKILTLADWRGVEEEEETLTHELVHALQDQSFDLGAYLDQTFTGTLDEQFARQAVIEGEAVGLTREYFSKESSKEMTALFQSPEEGSSGPASSTKGVVGFPYVYGPVFLGKYIGQYGWGGMDYLYGHPPSSTRQVLHPERFFPERKEPLKVKIEDLSGRALGGYEKIWESTLGEFGLTLVLGRDQPLGRIREAVAGWRGDCAQIYERKDSSRAVLVVYMVFESEDQAEKFYSVFREHLAGKGKMKPAENSEKL